MKGVNWKRVAFIGVLFYVVYTGGSCQMTIDEMDTQWESKQTVKRGEELVRMIDNRNGQGTAAYEIATGYEILALDMGQCPQCKDSITRNIELSTEDADFFDCQYSSQHKFILMKTGYI